MNNAIIKEIRTFVSKYQSNTELTAKWLTPLVGFASASDPLFHELKKAVSPTHALPGDLLQGAETVIVYFLPYDHFVAKSNKDGRMASREWALSYIDTNKLIVAINTHLAGILKHYGAETALLPPTHNFSPEKLISDWSHRHIAYIAGLGKFGLHNLLITENGCSGRLGSVVTTALLEPTRRPEGEYCLEKAGKTCKVCVKKCVGQALTDSGFNRFKCWDILLENDALHSEGDTDVCGKCCSITPCSFGIPIKSATA